MEDEPKMRCWNCKFKSKAGLSWSKEWTFEWTFYCMRASTFRNLILKDDLPENDRCWESDNPLVDSLMRLQKAEPYDHP